MIDDSNNHSPAVSKFVLFSRQCHGRVIKQENLFIAPGHSHVAPQSSPQPQNSARSEAKCVNTSVMWWEEAGHLIISHKKKNLPDGI